MTRNRSIPNSTVIPVLIYPDVREAVDWLGRAFGFRERLEIGENHRAQLEVGDGAVIIGDVRGSRRPPRAGEVTHSVVIRVEDATAHCERARANGAKIVEPLTDHEYRSGSTPPRISRAISGHSPRPSGTSIPRNRAAS